MTRTAGAGKTEQAGAGRVRGWCWKRSRLEWLPVKPGATCGEVDEAARSVLRKAGLAKFFTHSTGHGVGLEIHESPRLAAGQTMELKPGMVVTIEPGIYLAGKFGIRIEDMIAVTQRGNKVLTMAPKALIEL